MKLTLPFKKQHTEYSCGPASLEMVLAFLGDKKSEKFLIKKAHTNEETGTKHKWMIETSVNEGFYCHVNSYSTIYEIKHFLLLGYPVIVDYTEPSEDIGHYAVIIGYKNGNLIMNDPWNGKDFIISEDEFLERWHDDTTNSTGWMMVISKTDFKLGKQYLPI